MNILVTGGLGFIGHNVTRMLAEQQHRCTVIDNSTNYGFIPIKELEYLLEHRRARIPSSVNIVHGDITSQHDLERAFENGSDTVVHLASFPRQKVVNANPTLGASTMIVGLTELLEASVKNNIKHFVYISSSMVYGDFIHPYLDETGFCRPQGQYAVFKLAGEWLVKDYARRHGFKYTIIRPCAVYGEWDVRDRVVSQFVSQALCNQELTVNGPDEILDFTYVEDAAAGIVAATVRTSSHDQTYNITQSTADPHTLKHAADLAIAIAGGGRVREQEHDPDFPHRGRMSIVRAREELGFDPQVDLKEGIRRYCLWYKNHPSLLDLYD